MSSDSKRLEKEKKFHDQLVDKEEGSGKKQIYVVYGSERTTEN